MTSFPNVQTINFVFEVRNQFIAISRIHGVIPCNRVAIDSFELFVQVRPKALAINVAGQLLAQIELKRHKLLHENVHEGSG